MTSPQQTVTQRLYQQTAAMVDNVLRTVSLTFPPVPQGSAWTGTIQAVSNDDVAQPLAATAWILTKNGQPYLSWTGYGMAVDVQGTGQDTFTLFGQNVAIGVGGQILVTGQWIGRSDPQDQAPYVWPRVFGTPSVVAVVNFDPDGILVQDNGPAPGTLRCASVFQAAKNTTTTLIGGGLTDIRLWRANISLYTEGATAGELVARIQSSQVNTPDYLTCACVNAAGAQGVNDAALDLGGINIPAGSDVRLVTSNSNANIATSYAQVYYSFA